MIIEKLPKKKKESKGRKMAPPGAEKKCAARGSSKIEERDDLFEQRSRKIDKQERDKQNDGIG